MSSTVDGMHANYVHLVRWFAIAVLLVFGLLIVYGILGFFGVLVALFFYVAAWLGLRRGRAMRP